MEECKLDVIREDLINGCVRNIMESRIALLFVVSLAIVRN